MRPVYVPLRADEKEALINFAELEARDPRRQAARFIREGLIRAGVLAEQKTAGSPDDRPAA